MGAREEMRRGYPFVPLFYADVFVLSPTESALSYFYVDVLISFKCAL